MRALCHLTGIKAPDKPTRRATAPSEVIDEVNKREVRATSLMRLTDPKLNSGRNVRTNHQTEGFSRSRPPDMPQRPTDGQALRAYRRTLIRLRRLRGH